MFLGRSAVASVSSSVLLKDPKHLSDGMHEESLAERVISVVYRCWPVWKTLHSK